MEQEAKENYESRMSYIIGEEITLGPKKKKY
jgi:hypothetical protein